MIKKFLFSFFLLAFFIFPPPSFASSPFGMNVDLFWTWDQLLPPGKWELIVRTMAEAGVKNVRLPIYWPEIQGLTESKGTDPSLWKWDKHDQFIKLLVDNDIAPLAYFMFTPQWAYQDPNCNQDGTVRWQGRICAPNPQVFAYFVEKTVERYGCGPGGKCQIKNWEIWNEPDLNSNTYFYGSLSDYGQMLYRGYRAVKKSDPQAIVVLGGISQAGIEPGAYLDQLLSKTYLNKPASAYFDVFNFHYYYGHTNDLVYDGLKRVKQVLAKYGLESKPVWMTEVNRGGQCVDPNLVAAELTKVFEPLIAAGVEKIYWFEVAAKDNLNICGQANRFRHPPFLARIYEGDKVVDYRLISPMFNAYQAMTEASIIDEMDLARLLSSWPSDSEGKAKLQNLLSNWKTK
ncbi:MAG: cellulase family glycosylhydrolase [Candidatus Shapirobacteria bacterium]